MPKQSVLFLCTGNSARSQMAEALLRHHAANEFEVFSAGSSPEPVHPHTYQVLEKFGIKSNSLKSKSVDEFKGRSFDYVITLCDQASSECKNIPFKGKRLEWSFTDPKAANQPSYELEPFEQCLHAISQRINSFVMLERPGLEQQDKKSALDPNLNKEKGQITAVQIFKSLSDELRLKCLMLVQYEGELCVCELMQALEDSQPKVSRHLALLRKDGLLKDRRAGQWVFYRIHPDLPKWAKSILAETTDANIQDIKHNLSRLHAMGERPSRSAICCK